MRPYSDLFTVLILEDGTALRHRLVDLIGAIAGVGEVLEAGDAPTALALARHHRPHIVVLDIRVPGDPEVRNGLDVLGAIKRGQPDTFAIILTNFADSHYATLARQLGADAFLDKTTEFDTLVSLIENHGSRNNGTSLPPV